MILGTLFIAGGAVLIAIFGIVPDPTRSLDDLLELFARPPFIVYFTILAMVVIACLVAVRPLLLTSVLILNASNSSLGPHHRVLLEATSPRFPRQLPPNRRIFRS